MGARPRWDGNEISSSDAVGERMVERRWHVDDDELDAGLAQLVEASRYVAQGSARQLGGRPFAQRAPIGKAAIGIRIDECHRGRAGSLRLHRDMAGKRGLARATLLGGECQHAHRLVRTPRRSASYGRPASSTGPPRTMAFNGEAWVNPPGFPMQRRRFRALPP